MENKKTAEELHELSNNFQKYFKENLKTSLLLAQDNDLKRTRALKKAARERDLTCQKEKDLCILKEELKALNQKRDELAASVEAYTIFPQYLDQVVKISEQFEEPWQAISRVDTLVQTHEDLFTTNQQKQACADMTKNQLSQFLDQSNDKLMNSKNKLAKLQTDLDQESRLAHIQNTAAKKTLVLGSIKMATLNLYQLTMDNQKEDAVELEDTLHQLEKIQTYLWNLNSVWEDVEKLDTGPHLLQS
ncbi:coiled-coil domain-containing protein 42-like [Aplochiton taeniatus]